MPKPDITSIVACVNKRKGKKSRLVIRGSKFDLNAEVKLTDPSTGKTWTAEILKQTAKKIVIKIEAPGSLRGSKKTTDDPKEIETLDFTVTNPDTSQEDKQLENLESVDDPVD